MASNAVDFLTAKATRPAALDRLLALAAAIEATGAPSITEADMAAAIAASRHARRAGAPPS